MTVLIDPASGKRYDYADLSADDTETDRKAYGLLTPEQYEASKESFVKKAARVGAATVGAPLELASRVLPEGWRPPRGEEELAKQSPAARAFYEQ